MDFLKDYISMELLSYIRGLNREGAKAQGCVSLSGSVSVSVNGNASHLTPQTSHPIPHTIKLTSLPILRATSHPSKTTRS